MCGFSGGPKSGGPNSSAGFRTGRLTVIAPRDRFDSVPRTEQRAVRSVPPPSLLDTAPLPNFAKNALSWAMLTFGGKA